MYIFLKVDAHKDYTFFFLLFIQGIKILLGISGCYILLKYVKGHHEIHFYIVQRIIITKGTFSQLFRQLHVIYFIIVPYYGYVILDWCYILYHLHIFYAFFNTILEMVMLLELLLVICLKKVWNLACENYYGKLNIFCTHVLMEEKIENT